ncbi:MAG TPA: lipopolysaccharide transport periplasmic protein LptA [Syntrophorhabdaceae bacterium]|nr:lipopolysaccharide transport periplasmic protein LptA [Syntrophorhabdaceae bacterium]HOL04942.1 lipopolysaccharide transport periplasmic protein LptA [Syntrophorhabdaceae bacterium]HON85226.1 lipopolysaccharide transport periplasmic protein LptA [Syntrophorhabdaceae bacterium]HPC66528.1 lipopolysaccharide transport periplasmic protein LptA [Syntrophorhabdaceae bacterium]HPP41215.1 lipopolysaccharide transport periplasmic protein LptA [Syntrophorhabdaceae bacterium]
MKKIITLYIFIALCFLVSCASQPKKVEKPADLYVEGVNLMKAKKYDKAIEKFTQIKENFPFDPISFIATVKLGDVYFEKKEYVLASNVYEDFFNAHPEDENIPYVLNRLGECYEKLSLSFERDQTYTIKAIDRYTYLLNRYPASTYAKDVEQRRKVMIQKIIDREIYVGEFYYRTFQYNAATTRFETFLKKYPDATGTDKALYYLSLSYRQLGNQNKSDYYMEQLRTRYPDSRFLRSGIKRQRKSLQMAQLDLPTYTTDFKRTRTDINLKADMVVAQKTASVDEKIGFFDKKQPVDIVSDTMEGLEKEKYIIFKGNVVARQGDLYIFCDSIDAYMDEATNEIERAHAKGNVKIVKKDRTSTCSEAIFDNKKGEITLKGNVTVYSGQDKLTGDVIRYFLNEDRVVVEGEKDKKARIKVTPK